MELSAGNFHESDDRLELYALERLSDTEIIEVEEHLIVCETCRVRLEQNAAFALAIQNVLKEHPELAKDSGGMTGWSNIRSWFGSGLRWIGFQEGNPRVTWGGFAAVLVAGCVLWSGIAVGKRTARLAPAASLQLVAMRGEMRTVPRARQLDLTLADVSGTGAPFRIDVVNANGFAQWSGTPHESLAGLQVRIEKVLPAGAYFTRLYDASGSLIHEYGFRVLNR